ncbi:LPS-assembly protein LptD [Meiothermus luteus]|uniref:LPS-assembly protein LptD n=1 Tax=Meiothermus luteus TaxID=2026184 RepID=A0A399EA40_9DEIN|nr:hypothetical protein [Meiothermus luteus]RIH81564.1 LPS-assembly protein LptD [Meiothermus luteus]
MWRLKTNQALGSLVATFLLSLAWAAPCREQPYTLETPEGLAGGGNLEFDGEVALFTDGACLEARGLTLRAPSLRYDQASGELTAREVEVETPRYRFWAEEAWVKGQTLRASGVRATTCRCGEDLRLLSQSLVLNTQTGEAVLEESWLEVYRFGLARFEELTFSPGQSLGEVLGLTEAGEALPAPLRFDFDQGLNFGLSEFPLAGPQRFSTRLTLLGLRLGSPDPVLRLGLSARERQRRASLQLDAKPSGFASSGEVVDGPLFFVHDSAAGRYAFGLRQGYSWADLAFSPFGWVAQDWRDGTPATQVQGLAAGAELRYALSLQEGPFRLRMEPFGVFALYDQAPGYLAYGGQVEGRYEGAFNLHLGYSWGTESGLGRFWLERREATHRLFGGLELPGLELRAEHDFLKSQTQGSLRLGYRQDYGEFWLRYSFCADCVGKTTSNGRSDWERRELVLGFTPSPLTCTYDLSLSPLLGYDFLRQGVSRFGLELRYADCCFVWRLGYQEVRIAQHPDEIPSGKFTFGLEIR